MCVMADELHGLLKYAAIVGLAPVTSDSRRQRVQQIITLLVVSLYLAVTIYGIVLVWLQQRLIVSQLVNVFLYMTAINSSSVIMLESLLTYRHHLAFYEKLKRIRHRFAQPPLQVAICRHTLRRQQVRQVTIFVIVMCGFYVAKIGFIEHHNHQQPQQQKQHGYHHYLFQLPSSLITHLRCLQITLYAGYMIQYMRLFNTQLQALLATVVARRCGHERLTVNISSTLDRLTALKQLYKEIYELSVLFNEFFGWSLVFLATLILFSLIVSAYGTFHRTLRFDTMYMPAVSLLSIIPKVLMISLLCRSGQQLIVQHREAVGYVHRLIGRSMETGTNQARQYHDLNAEFALQLMQTRIQIDGKQFHIFNMKMLMQLCVALISYLVILLQFCADDNNE